MPDNAQAPQGGTGLAPNVAGALSYFLGPLTGILFLVLEKQNSFVRFHAAQSIGVGVAWVILWVAFSILSMVLSAIPIIGLLISLLIWLVVGLGGFVLWLLLMFRAFQGVEWELPYIGAQSRKLLSQPAAQ